jgi:transcriptional regulator with XRE-family HTH domain
MGGEGVIMNWDKALSRMNELGISQYQLSLALGKDKTQVGKWISRNNNPPGDCLIKMSKIMNVRVEYFFPEEYPNLVNESDIRRRFKAWIDDMSDEEMKSIEELFKALGAYGEKLGG